MNRYSKMKLLTWAESLINRIFDMKETPVKCSDETCNYGALPYQGSTEIRTISIDIIEGELDTLDCPKCEKPTLIKA